MPLIIFKAMRSMETPFARPFLIFRQSWLMATRFRAWWRQGHAGARDFYAGAGPPERGQLQWKVAMSSLEYRSPSTESATRILRGPAIFIFLFEHCREMKKKKTLHQHGISWIAVIQLREFLSVTSNMGPRVLMCIIVLPEENPRASLRPQAIYKVFE